MSVHSKTPEAFCATSSAGTAFCCIFSPAARQSIMAEKLSSRVARIEELMVLLTESQLKTEEQLRRQSEEMDRRFAETDRRLRELGEKTDERIGKLVLAIGEMLRRNGGGK